MHTERHKVWRGGRLLGEVWHTGSGWYATPYGSDQDAIPCTSGPEAVSTVERLGTARIKATA